jgi:hypothetical protein
MDGSIVDTALQSPAVKYELLNPAFWFEKMVTFIKWLFDVIFNNTTGDLLQGIFYFLAIFFITIIIYTAVRMFEIRKKEHAYVHHEIAEYSHHLREKEKKKRDGEGISKNPRWVKVLEHLMSTNVNDWKLAVIEADSMLDSMMTDLGFKGDGLGEKLKGADRSKFRNLTSAWEVHTARNRIAHEGSAYDLSLHEARRLIALYEQIFREFGYI